MKPQRWLAPLVPVYNAAVHAKNAAYDRGIFSIEQLKSPVISIGNLSTGGNGKTPLVIALANLLTANGISIDVLSRGYGRTSDATVRVVPGNVDDADRYGDEPLLIANATNVPVFVGKSRFSAGTLAEKAPVPGNHLHLLDDGFQHRRLARDLDILVLHSSDLTESLLPAGNLREPLSSLRRARVIVVREEDRGIMPRVQKYLHDSSQIWYIRRTFTCRDPYQRVVAFCGIARPDEFFAGLRSLGMELAAAVAYPDHHRYSEADMSHLIEQCRGAGAVRLITTEKDEVRLGSQALAKLSESVLLGVAKLDIRFLEPDLVLATIRSVLAGRSSHDNCHP